MEPSIKTTQFHFNTTMVTTVGNHQLCHTQKKKNVLEGNTFNFGITEPLPVKPVMDAEPSSLVSRVIEIVKLHDYIMKIYLSILFISQLRGFL